MEQKVEHLKLIQAVITRMGANSFLLKGWTVALIAALFAFAAKDADRGLVVVAWIPVIVFCGLDGFYLWQEKLFINLYEHAATNHLHSDFSMDIRPYKAHVGYWQALRSKAILGFYIPMILLMAAVTAYMAAFPKPSAVPVQGTKTITISIQ